MSTAFGWSVGGSNLFSLACQSTDLRPWVFLLCWQLYLLLVCILSLRKRSCSQICNTLTHQHSTIAGWRTHLVNIQPTNTVIACFRRVCRLFWYLVVRLHLSASKHEREPVVASSCHKKLKRCLVCPVWATVKNMAASVQRIRSHCKYKMAILGQRKQQVVQFRWNTWVKHIPRIILYSISANRSLSPKSYTLDL